VDARHTDVVEALYGHTHLPGHCDGLLQNGQVRGAGAYGDEAAAGRSGLSRTGDEGLSGVPYGYAGECFAQEAFLLGGSPADDHALRAVQDGGADLRDLLGGLGAGVDDLGDALAFGAAEVQGGYTAYAAGFILFQLPHAIFTVSVVTALLPAMSSRWAAGDRAGLRTLVARGIRATGVIVIPATLAYLAIGRDIVRLLFEHGATEARSGELVADVLALFALGLFFFSTFQLLLRAFYAMQDTRTPALINLGSFAVNASANLLFVLVFDLGVRGLALGHATSYLFSSTVALLVLRRRLEGFRGERIGRSLGSTLVAAGLTAVVAWGTARLIGGWLGTVSVGAQAVQVFAAIGVGLVVFFLAALIFRIEEVDTVKRHILARWR